MFFRNLAVGARFRCNGNLCEKRSTRTACILEYGRTFYYTADTRVTAA